MGIESFQQHLPNIHASAFVASSADVIGRVQLAENVSIWYQATLRGDINEIVIGPNSNVQDNAVVHLADDYGAYIGEYVTVGHSAIVHACEIKSEVLVGMGSIIMDGAVIGERSIVGAGALVTSGTIIPAASLVLGSPARVVKTLDRKDQRSGRDLAEKYVKNAQLFRQRANGGSVE